MFSLSLALYSGLLTSSMSSLSPYWFIVYFALIAGGKDPQNNDQSHQEHLSRLMNTLEQHHIRNEHITVFWADGESPEPDRKLPSTQKTSHYWVVEDTPWEDWFAKESLLANTRWEQVSVFPAKRSALRQWFKSISAKLKPNDSLVLAVTDHGRPDPKGAWQTSIELWGEALKVEELYQDLQLLPTQVSIQLWMSQCFSGGFARLSTMDSRVCGAFSSASNRPAYGCFTLPSAPSVEGHFLKFTEGLKQGGRLDQASRWAVEHDITPDTPHLSSDAFVRRIVRERSEALGIPEGHLIDAALPVLNQLSVEQQQIVKTITNTSLRFNLGLTHSYTRVSILNKQINELIYSLKAWHTQWKNLLYQAKLRLLKQAPIDAFTQKRKHRRRSQKKARLQRWINRALKRGKEGRRGLLKELQQKVSRAETLLDQLKTIEASLWRIGTLYAGLAAKDILTEHDYGLWRKMKSCEARSILQPHRNERQTRSRKRDNTQFATDFQSFNELQTEVESLRPGYIAFQYRERSRASRLEVRSLDYGSPLWAVDLQVGDLIESINRSALNYTGQVREMIALHPIGEWIKIKRRRDGKVRSIHIPVVGAPLSPPPPLKGEPIPPLSLDPILEDKKVDYLISGGRPTLLYFWSTWCQECLRVAPQIQAWAQAHDIQVLAITTEDPHLVRAVNHSSPLPFTIFHDRNREASRLFRADLQNHREAVFIYLDVERRFIERGIGLGQKGPKTIELLFDN